MQLTNRPILTGILALNLYLIGGGFVVGTILGAIGGGTVGEGVLLGAFSFAITTAWRGLLIGCSAGIVIGGLTGWVLSRESIRGQGLNSGAAVGACTGGLVTVIYIGLTTGRVALFWPALGTLLFGGYGALYGWW